MAAARRRRLRPAALATLLVALLVLVPVAAAPASPSASAASAAVPAARDEATTRVTITSITPMIDDGDQVAIEGEITNESEEDLASTSVSVVPKETETGRTAVRDWAEGTGRIRGTAVGRTSIADLPAGESTPFAITLDGDDLARGVATGAAWISVQTHDAAVHTFVGIHRTKEYEPLRVVWGIPLLLPSDKDLFGETGETRTAAWRDAVGEDSGIAELTAQPPAPDEAWLLDPSLLRTSPDAPSGVPEERRDDASTEQELRRERADAIRETLVGEQTLVLPGADADIAAGAESPDAAELIRPRVTQGQETAAELGARADVVWPADGDVTTARSRAYNQLVPGSQMPTVLAPDVSFAPSGFTPTGGTRTTGGTPVIVRDSDLSELVGDLESTSNRSLARQQLIAGTASLLQERAGTPRTLFIVPDRGSRPDPDAYAQLRDAAEEIPWLRSGSLAELLDSARTAPKEQTPKGDEELARTHLGPQNPLLTAERSEAIRKDRRAMRTFASVRADGPEWLRYITPDLNQLTSARWRGEKSELEELHAQLSEDVTLTEDELVVSSGDVNFFAESGRLQVTVINKTRVELTNLHMRLEPENPSLRIDEGPEQVTVGPDGRQTVTVRASALAAARVPVNVNVYAPGGTDLTAPATLHITVRPTGGQVYWVIGVAAALLLGLGTWRTLRGGRRTKGASEPDQRPTEENG